MQIRKKSVCINLNEHDSMMRSEIAITLTMRQGKTCMATWRKVEKLARYRSLHHSQNVFKKETLELNLLGSNIGNSVFPRTDNSP